jgi:broad specificity phosphatase PhoE
MSSAARDRLPVVVLARHGETEWSRTGQHTGRTDLPLTARGEDDARRLGERLRGRSFARAYTSPLQRASRTCALAGFEGVAEVDPDLVEWDYGKYEGLRTDEIRAERPGWTVFRDGCPDGESPEDVAVRADRFIARVREASGDVLVFSSAHFLRMLTARWLGLPPSAGALWILGTASLSALGYDHDRSEPVIRLWNEVAPPIDREVTR